MAMADIGVEITRRLGDDRLCLFCVSLPPSFVEVVIWLQICDVKCGLRPIFENTNQEYTGLTHFMHEFSMPESPKTKN